MSTQQPDSDDTRVAMAAAALFSIVSGVEPTAQEMSELHAYDDAELRDGLRLQLAVLRRWRGADEEVGGWKIGWTSRSARDRGGPGFRPFGFVLTSRIFASGASLEGSLLTSGWLEPEICLIMGQRLAGPDVTVSEARAAVSGIAPAFEICLRRLPPGLSLAVSLGGDLNNWGMVVGSAQPPDLAIGDLTVEVRQSGSLIASGASTPDVLDDPFLSLTRVCRELDTFGLGLEPGQAVLTGSLAAQASLSQPGLTEASFGALGTVEVRIGDR